MIKISKDECIKLQKIGYHFGDNGYLHHTWNNHRQHTYYLVENEKALNDLKRIKNSN